MQSIPRRDRARHALVYGALVCALLLPYRPSSRSTAVCAAISSRRRRGPSAIATAPRSCGRASSTIPTASRRPRRRGRRCRVAGDDQRQPRGVDVLHGDRAAHPRTADVVGVEPAFEPGWPRTRARSCWWWRPRRCVLDAGFLRSPLAARLADPSRTHWQILVAWMAASLPKLLVSGAGLGLAGARAGGAIRTGLLVAALPVALVVAVGMSADFVPAPRQGRVDRSRRQGVRARGHRVGADLARIGSSRRVNRPDRPELIDLSLQCQRMHGRDGLRNGPGLHALCWRSRGARSPAVMPICGRASSRPTTRSV